jgi:hypothetical protein
LRAVGREREEDQLKAGERKREEDQLRRREREERGSIEKERGKGKRIN